MLPLMLTAFAAEPQVGLSVGAQVHPGAPGQPSAWALGWGQVQAGPALVEGYGDFVVGDGFAPNLYVLTADGETGALRWTLGRQRLILPTNPRLLDGASTSWRGASTEVEAAAGFAHAWDAGAGVGLARVSARAWSDEAEVGAGFWGELDADGATQLHSELRGAWGEETRMSARAVAALSGGKATLELARVEGRGRPLAGVDAGVHLEHREAPPLLTATAPSIMASFAPDGLEELGGVVGVAGRDRTRTTATAALRTWDDGAQGRQLGAAGSLAWAPAGPDWAPRPSWRFATGPMGTVHVLSAASSVPVPDRFDVTVTAGLAPYLKPYKSWDTAWWAGASAGVALGPVEVKAGGEVGRSVIAPIDPRAWLVLAWETR